jgi:hypothetical protein
MKSKGYVMTRIMLGLLFCLGTLATTTLATGQDDRRRCLKECQEKYQHRLEECREKKGDERRECRQHAAKDRRECREGCHR